MPSTSTRCCVFGVAWALCTLTALQHTATHCNTLQHTATHCNALCDIRYAWFANNYTPSSTHPHGCTHEIFKHKNVYMCVCVYICIYALYICIMSLHICVSLYICICDSAYWFLLDRFFREDEAVMSGALLCMCARAGVCVCVFCLCVVCMCVPCLRSFDTFLCDWVIVC